MSGLPRDGVAVCYHDDTLTARSRHRSAGRRPDGGRARDAGRPDARGRARRDPAPRIPRRRAEGRPRARRVRGARRPAAGPASSAPSSRRSSRPPSSGSAGLAPTWPRWLNADDARRDDRARRSSSAVAGSRSSGMPSTRGCRRPGPRRRSRGRRLDRPPPADVRPARAARRRGRLRGGGRARRLTGRRAGPAIARPRRAAPSVARRRPILADDEQRSIGPTSSSSAPGPSVAGRAVSPQPTGSTGSSSSSGGSPAGRAAARPGSSAPRAARRRPSRSAAGRSTSTGARPSGSAPTAASASSAT